MHLLNICESNIRKIIAFQSSKIITFFIVFRLYNRDYLRKMFQVFNILLGVIWCRRFDNFWYVKDSVYWSNLNHVWNLSSYVPKIDSFSYSHHFWNKIENLFGFNYGFDIGSGRWNFFIDLRWLYIIIRFAWLARFRP